VKPNVFLIVASIVVLLATVGAFVQAFTSMNAQMGLVVAVVLVVLPAQIAHERPLARVQAYVTCKMRVLSELLATVRTCVRLLQRVQLHM
jgi:hypothetical protein